MTVKGGKWPTRSTEQYSWLMSRGGFHVSSNIRVSLLHRMKWPLLKSSCGIHKHTENILWEVTRDIHGWQLQLRSELWNLWNFSSNWGRRTEDGGRRGTLCLSRGGPNVPSMTGYQNSTDKLSPNFFFLVCQKNLKCVLHCCTNSCCRFLVRESDVTVIKFIYSQQDVRIMRRGSKCASFSSVFYSLTLFVFSYKSTLQLFHCR